MRRMICAVIFAVICCADARMISSMVQDPIFSAMRSDLGGVMYAIPEYEDPDALEYELAAMGASPLVSLLQMAKHQQKEEFKDKTVPSKETVALMKETLDDVISRLTTIQTTLHKGHGVVHYSDIEKSISGLKKLEANFRPEGGSSIPDALPPIHKTRLMGVMMGVQRMHKMTDPPNTLGEEGEGATSMPAEEYFKYQLDEPKAMADEESDDSSSEEPKPKASFKRA